MKPDRARQEFDACERHVASAASRARAAADPVRATQAVELAKNQARAVLYMTLATHACEDAAGVVDKATAALLLRTGAAIAQSKIVGEARADTTVAAIRAVDPEDVTRVAALVSDHVGTFTDAAHSRIADLVTQAQSL